MGATRHVLSFGGGVNSVALMILLTRSGAPLDEAVFADTGGEVPETYQYLPIARDYLAAYGVPLTSLAHRKAGRDLYQNCWDRRVIPSAIWRWSTRDFKVLPLHRYYRALGTHISQYLAIAYDEIERIRDSSAPYITNVYPLVDMKIDRQGCVKIIEQAGLPVPVKSGCFFCPFNSLERWRWLHETHPVLYQEAVALEERSKHFPLQRLTDQVFRRRDSVTLRDLPARFDTGVSGRSEEGSPCGGECMT